MMQQKLALPVQCIVCGSLFDITYDLQNSDTLENNKIENLCWGCRVMEKEL